MPDEIVITDTAAAQILRQALRGIAGEWDRLELKVDGVGVYHRGQRIRSITDSAGTIRINAVIVQAIHDLGDQTTQIVMMPADKVKGKR